MTIEDDIAFLERVPSFAILGRDALRILAIGAESRYVHHGEVLFTVGDPADAGYVVQDGSFTLKTDNTDAGAPEMTVTSGALLGELALLTETIRPVTAIAAEPSTVIRVTRSLFLKMLEGFPDAARRLRDHIAARTSQAAADMTDVRATLDPQRPRRVAHPGDRRREPLRAQRRGSVQGRRRGRFGLRHSGRIVPARLRSVG